MDEISGKWTDFVNGVSKSRIAVGISLREAHVMEVTNGMVRLACSDEYNVSTLRRNKEFLSEMFHQVVGKRAAIESVLHSGKTSVPQIVNQSVHAVQPDAEKKPQIAQQEDGINDHPVLSLLKRELSAERIE